MPDSNEPRFAPWAMGEDGKPVVICVMCGSTDLDLDGWDIDKCRACGHWRYRDTYRGEAAGRSSGGNP